MFALTFLGTSASVPSAERNHPGLLIEAGSQRILVDCGEGTQRQLFRGAGFRRLDRLLLTHGHFDHVLGIPGLFSTLRLRRSADLMTIHGSPGTLDVVVRMLAGLWGEGNAPIPLELVPLAEGQVIDARGCRVSQIAAAPRAAEAHPPNEGIGRGADLSNGTGAISIVHFAKRIYGAASPRLRSLRRSSIASIRSSLRSRWTS
jgi:ribonuclease BN (tRNA processing enzyme)